MFFSVGLVAFITLGALYLFQHDEHKRWQDHNDGIIIDVNVSLID